MVMGTDGATIYTTRRVTLLNEPYLNDTNGLMWTQAQDNRGFQYQIALDVLPAGIDIGLIHQGQTWFVSNDSTAYRLQLFVGSGISIANYLTMPGDTFVATASGVVTRVPIGSDNQVLTVSGGTAVWNTISITGGITQLTGDVTAGPGSGSQAATLASVGSAGTYGTASGIPVITTDVKGRVTSVTTIVPTTTRVLSITANTGTPSINTNNYNVVHITSQSAAITSFTTNLTGTPVDGQTLRISVTGSTAIALTWGTSFESSTATLPTTTVGTTRLDIGFFWNTETSRWRCVAVA